MHNLLQIFLSNIFDFVQQQGDRQQIRAAARREVPADKFGIQRADRVRRRNRTSGEQIPGRRLSPGSPLGAAPVEQVRVLHVGNQMQQGDGSGVIPVQALQFGALTNTL